MQGGKAPPPGPFGSGNLHGRTPLFNPNLFPPGSIQAMTVQRILQDPASFAQFYSHVFGGNPEGSDDENDDVDDDDAHSCCPCCSGQSFEDRMIATITRFVNPIVTADHAEDARQKIHCKVDLETEMAGVLEALQFWLEGERSEAEEENDPEFVKLIQSSMARIESEVASDFRQFKKSRDPITVEELHALREKWRKVAASVFFEVGKIQTGVGGTPDAYLPPFFSVPPDILQWQQQQPQQQQGGATKDTKEKKGKKVRRCATCLVEQTSSTKLKKCARCQDVYYCGVACQMIHWPTHKETCAPKAKAGRKAWGEEG